MNTDIHAEILRRATLLSGANAHYIEELYRQWLEDPASVDSEWREFFSVLREDAENIEQEVSGPSWKRKDWPPAPVDELTAALTEDWTALEEVERQLAEKGGERGQPLSPEEIKAKAKDSVRALMMIRAYRVRGHLAADLDPLRLREPIPHPELDPATYGFRTDRDRKRKIFLDGVLGMEWGTIDEILAILKRTYCGHLGYEFMHISDPQQKAWIQERIEGPDKEIAFTGLGKKAILAKLVEAETFEKFLHTKYTGTKRFGLEGAESIIPALEQVIKRGGQMGVEEITIGMAHRGRLNVLANVMGKPYRVIFHEFRGGSATPEEVEGSGDVKYHLGASSDREFDDNRVHLSLAANPSHLEIVDPVVLGKARSKQDQRGDTERRRVLPLLLHGDAAFAGQGVVAECFALSDVAGHRYGGSVHFIINNQIGFTTSPIWGRSSPYPSDVAKMVGAPIIHVNGDDPEAVVFAARIATEFRQIFGKPVVVDMFCYRRHGHNEADEPSFTQPLMYRRIRQHPTVVEIYARKLIREGVVTEEEFLAMVKRFRTLLEEEFDAATDYVPESADWLKGRWSALKPPHSTTLEDPRRGKTDLEIETLKKIGRALTTVPENFNIHPTLKRVIAARQRAIEDGRGIDWATAEQLAWGGLLLEGYRVRLSGQDVRRGTFSQRHAVWVDQMTDECYVPLNNIDPGQSAKADFINSILSEEAVLGFEYGYSLVEPNCLVMWEAQFGDFANGAQVIFDQFISSAERKWLRMSGLTCLLPHGYEGQGPEHSSARLERYLQLCAQDNMQVANCTTPANYFHILRRQMKRDFRKPLILMTPKSLLRHRMAVSTLEEMGPGSHFRRTLADDAERLPDATTKLVPDDRIRRVVMCSGKVYYDLYAEREKRGIDDIYLLRIEQLYPFPHRLLVQELSRFPKEAEYVWCQEEPWNMGAWHFVEPHIEWVLTTIGAQQTRPAYAGRPAAAAPATGLLSKHLKEQARLLDEALGEERLAGRAWGANLVQDRK